MILTGFKGLTGDDGLTEAVKAQALRKRKREDTSLKESIKTLKDEANKLQKKVIQLDSQIKRGRTVSSGHQSAGPHGGERNKVTFSAI
jgi:uncharacterized protein YlxW (UPF0749 family)